LNLIMSSTLPQIRWSDIDKNKESYEQRQYKLVVLGDGAVGKTSLCERFINDRFDNSYRQTIGCDFYVHRVTLPCKTKGKVNVAMQIWDIGGQSITSKMMNSYIYGAHAIILCYDITNIQTFININQWYNLILKTFKDKTLPYVSIIGNKSDLNHLRAVKNQKHYNFCDTHDCVGFFVSARTGENLLASFYKITSDVSGIPLTKNQIESLTKTLQASIIDYAQNNPNEKTVKEHVTEHKTSRCIIT